MSSLFLARTRLSHPVPDLSSLSLLRRLQITGLQGEGLFPHWVVKLTNLIFLDLSGSGLKGTIPEMPTIQHLLLNDNKLSGTLPELPAIKLLDVHNNKFTGTIPKSAGNQTSRLTLSRNGFGPDIDPDMFIHNKKLSVLDLSHNSFTGALPRLTADKKISIDLSYNKFEGSIPSNYCYSREIYVSHNRLSGNLSDILDSRCSLYKLHIDDNAYTGKFPEIRARLTVLDVSGNDFSGRLPLLPYSMIEFYASRTGFNSDGFEEFTASAKQGRLTLLDLSGIGLTFPKDSTFSIFELVGEKLEYLYVAHNRFPSSLAEEKHVMLRGLDMTNNSLPNPFPSALFGQLTVLKIAQNRFSEPLPFVFMEELAEIDISENEFQFDAASISKLPLLTIIRARKNKLFGSLDLGRLPNLESADFSENLLDQPLDLDAIGQQFTNFELIMLNISLNLELPLSQLRNNTSGLARTKTSAPSDVDPSSVLCYELAFHNTAGRMFAFDEDLFNYDQCDCNRDHFGAPPNNCVPCPSSGMKSCGGPEATVKAHSFAYITHSANNGSMVNTSVERDASIFETLFSAWSSITHDSNTVALEIDSYDANVTIALHTESCLITALQRLSGRSNCIGVQLTSENMSSPNVSIEHVLATQCMAGSEGRLCSKCICGSNDDDCWFIHGPQCSHCKRAFKFSASLPLAFAVSIVVLTALSLAMAIILHQKRSQSLKRWDKLPLWKRIFYRTQLLTSLGNVSILVTFVQMLVSFTQWDAYAETGLLGIVNGDGSRYETFETRFCRL